MQVQVIKKPLKYGTRNYGIGELVKMTDKHARLFIAIGRAGRPTAPRPDIPASPSLPVTIVETNETGAQPEAEVTAPTVEQQQESTAPAERSRRQYRRRDIRPENRDPQAED